MVLGYKIGEVFKWLIEVFKQIFEILKYLRDKVFPQENLSKTLDKFVELLKAYLETEYDIEKTQECEQDD